MTDPSRPAGEIGHPTGIHRPAEIGRRRARTLGHPWRVRSPLTGPPPALPAPLDRLAERWARLRPRVRAAVVASVVLAFADGQAANVRAAQDRWGGAGEPVWRATATVPAGADVRGHLEQVRLPLAALPPDAVTAPLQDESVLAITLVEGAVLTRAHLSPAGPAGALPPDQRLVPIPVEASWGVEAGSVVDVWVVAADRPAGAPGDDGRGPQPVATARPVLQVAAQGGRAVALVALHADDVAATTAGLSRGGIVLTLRGGR
jgi:hypothetical protein